MADLQTVKIKDLIETQQVMTTDYLVLEKDTGTFKCQARYLKGATGLTPNVKVGNTTTLAPGQLATVTQRGNAENPIFDFGIPQGVQGQIGPQGPKGDTPDITPLQTQIDNRFNALTSQQQGSSEVIDARGGYPALKARLDAINDDLIKYNDQTIVTHTTENNFSSIDATKNGYLDDVLLEGKTLVVDSNNNVVIPGTQGAILKSVGDGVNEIDLNSINKNLFNKSSNYTNPNNAEIEILETGIRYKRISTTSSSPVEFDIEIGAGRYYFKSDDGSGLRIYLKNSKTGYEERIYINQYFNISQYCDKFKIECFSVNYNANMTNLMVSKDNYSYENYKINTKKVLYKDTDGTWKKPTLRQWDSIEKHSDGKYYYHKRSEEQIINGTGEILKGNDLATTSGFNIKLNKTTIPNSVFIISDSYITDTKVYSNDIEGIFGASSNVYLRIKSSKANDITTLRSYLNNNNFKVVYKLLQEEIFECTPIDLISYDTQTNYSIECGPIYPKTTLKVNSYLGNVVSILKDKVSNLEDMFKLVVAGNMQELAYQLYPQDFVSNVDDSVDMEVIK